MRSFFEWLCTKVPFCKRFRSRFPEEEIQRLEGVLAEAKKDTDKLATQLEKITDKAKEDNRNPLQALGHDIKRAEFRKRIRAGDW